MAGDADELEERLGELEDRLDEFSGLVANLVRFSSEADPAIAKINRDVDDLWGRLQGCEAELGELRERFASREDLRRGMGEMEDRLSELGDRLDALET